MRASNKKLIEDKLGHRQRIFQKLKNCNSDSLLDYEVVELMLFLVFKRKDTKPLAKKLINEFKTINKILSAPEEKLLKIDGIGKSTINLFNIINIIVKSVLLSKIKNKSTITCYSDVLNFCKTSMNEMTSEELRILSLNKNFEVIDISTVQNGTIDSIVIYPREVIKHCLKCGATAFILVHNHPSGDPTPSRNDLYSTKIIQEAGKVFNIILFDHIIIGNNRYSSFRELNLIN